jgi:integral membrane protein
MNYERFLSIFRWVALLEGLSYLVLLFIAMPLKYMYGEPVYVRAVGMAHGVLFTLYVIQLLYAKAEYKWSMRAFLLLGVASVLPFGTFYADRKWLKHPASLTA